MGERPRDRLRAFFARNSPLSAPSAGLWHRPALAPEVLVRASHVLVVAILLMNVIETMLRQTLRGGF